MKTIKSIYLLALIVSFIFLFEGCKKDDDPTPAEQLVGSWKEVSYVATGCTDAADNESTTCTSNCETIVVTATTLKFDSDPAIPYTTSGNTITVTFPGLPPETATFAIAGSTLTITVQNSAANGGCKTVSTYTKV